MRKESVHDILERLRFLKYRLVLDGLIIGILTGMTVVLYRVLAKNLAEYMKVLYVNAASYPLMIPAVFIILIMLAIVVSQMVSEQPMISGSGIPQVEGLLRRQLSTNWIKVLIYKFLGGIICLAAGLSVGREGPSIQMGSCIGDGFAQTSKKRDNENKYLITGGASAGLASAFGAPLAGVMFALEEVHKNFSPSVLITAMIAATSADFVTKQFVGLYPALHLERLTKMPLNDYWTLILLGIMVGISGTIFNKGIMGTKNLYAKSRLSHRNKIIIPFLMTGVVGLFFPNLIGGGHEIIMSLKIEQYTVLVLIALLAAKFIFTFACFGSGVPGGIFFPLLAIGAIVGNICGVISVQYLGVSRILLINYIVLAMAGHFASTVKAPITGIILIFEMTGSFEQLLPLAVVVFTSMFVSDILKNDPIYESLLEDLLNKGNHEGYKGAPGNKTLMEFSIMVGSKCANKKVMDIEWPEKTLVVSVFRGKREIIPNGDTKLLEGDMITVMMNQTDSSHLLEQFEDLTMCR